MHANQIETLFSRQYNKDCFNDREFLNKDKDEDLEQFFKLSYSKRNEFDSLFEEKIAKYILPLTAIFKKAKQACPEIKIDTNIMSGAPCVQGTRIPVYMILDAIAHYGSLKGAIKSYPKLSVEQIKQAVNFAKIVVECPVEHEITSTTR